MRYPAVLSLAAAASDADGSVARVEFFAGSTALGSDTAAPFALSWNPPPGVHSLTARATDNAGRGHGVARHRRERGGRRARKRAQSVAPGGSDHADRNGRRQRADGHRALSRRRHRRRRLQRGRACRHGKRTVRDLHARSLAGGRTRARCRLRRQCRRMPAGSSTPLSQVVSSQQVWVDDAIPAGARMGGEEPGPGSPPARRPFAGARAHTSSTAAGTPPALVRRRHADARRCRSGTRCSPTSTRIPRTRRPRSCCSGTMGHWDHRAYWGANLIA